MGRVLLDYQGEFNNILDELKNNFNKLKNKFSNVKSGQHISRNVYNKLACKFVNLERKYYANEQKNSKV